MYSGTRNQCSILTWVNGFNASYSGKENILFKVSEDYCRG